MTKEEARRKFDEMAKKLAEIPPCPHCGRFVLAGPPCCYQLAVDHGYKGTAEEWLKSIYDEPDEEAR